MPKKIYNSAVVFMLMISACNQSLSNKNNSIDEYIRNVDTNIVNAAINTLKNDINTGNNDDYIYTDFKPFTVDFPLPDTPFFNDCLDMYNSCQVKTSLFTNLDWWYRIGDSVDIVGALEKIDENCIRNDEIRQSANEVLSSFKCYLSSNVVFERNEELDALMELYYTYVNQLNMQYNTFKYVNLTEKEYWDALDFTSSPKFRKLYKRRKTDRTVNKIYRLFKEEIDFDTKCKYARLYTDFVGILGSNTSDLEDLLDAGIYSHQLYFIWRIWRCAVQLSDSNYGPSTWSPIPNRLYNEKRRQVALTTLKYLLDNPDDKIAVNQYIMTCGEPNIYRFGDFPVGNESFTEVQNLGLSLNGK